MTVEGSADTGFDNGFDVVYADTLRYFPDLVTDLGGNPGALLAEYGIETSDPSHGGSHYGYRMLVTLLEHGAAALGRPDFGLRLALRQGGGSVFGPVGDAMRNSKTLGDAVEYVERHSHAHSLAARIRLEHDASSGSVFVAHDILLDRLPNKSQAMEQFLLLAHLNAMEITGGRARVRQVRFRHQPLSPPAVYRRLFGCGVYFDQRVDGVLFSEADVACRTVAPDASAYRAVTSLIDTAFPRVSPVRAQVRGVVLQYLGSEQCTNELIAGELNLHPRTLHRRLKAEGTACHEIKDDVRRDLALYYLQQTDLDFTRIAERLGYSEHSVLTRSCLRWFAASPSKVRAGSDARAG
jgi:AraC-like DNA-binding protein